jgi:hypothetical protein
LRVVLQIFLANLLVRGLADVEVEDGFFYKVDRNVKPSKEAPRANAEALKKANSRPKSEKFIKVSTYLPARTTSDTRPSTTKFFQRGPLEYVKDRLWTNQPMMGVPTSPAGPT